jgi:hypothetical protein
VIAPEANSASKANSLIGRESRSNLAAISETRNKLFTNMIQRAATNTMRKTKLMIIFVISPKPATREAMGFINQSLKSLPFVRISLVEEILAVKPKIVISKRTVGKK